MIEQTLERESSEDWKSFISKILEDPTKIQFLPYTDAKNSDREANSIFHCANKHSKEEVSSETIEGENFPLVIRLSEENEVPKVEKGVLQLNLGIVRRNIKCYIG